MTIPRLFFTYWEGDRLTELHYFTILSFLNHNPTDNVIIYTAQIPSNSVVQWRTGEHAGALHKTIKLKDLVAIDPTRVLLKTIDFASLGVEQTVSPVFKADITRIYKLYEHGGIWFDMDMLFIQKIDESLLSHSNGFAFRYYNRIPTGFIGMREKCAFMTHLYERATEIIRRKAYHDYQCLGPLLWTEVFNKHSELTILPTHYVYPYDCLDYSNFFNNNTAFIKSDTLAVHWYNGGDHARHYINYLDLKSLDPEKSVCNRVLFDLMTSTRKSPSDAA